VLALIIGAVRAGEIDQRLPGGVRLVLREALEDHPDLQAVVGPRDRLLAPMGIAEARRIELDEAGEEPAIGVVGARAKSEVHSAEGLGELVGGQRHARDDAERAAPAPFQRPEEIGLAGLVDNAGLGVGGDDLGFQQARRDCAVGFGKAAEAAPCTRPGTPSVVQPPPWT
jgi:hypothetical protein